MLNFDHFSTIAVGRSDDRTHTRWNHYLPVPFIDNIILQPSINIVKSPTSLKLPMNTHTLESLPSHPIYRQHYPTTVDKYRIVKSPTSVKLPMRILSASRGVNGRDIRFVVR